MTVFIENQIFDVRHCPTCGIAYGLPQSYWEKRQSDGKSWYCPNGHSLSFHETTETKLKKELERKQQMLDAAQAKARTAEVNLSRVSKAHQKMRTRVMNGVCVCCNRSFGNLREHMKNEHPDFTAQNVLLSLRTAFGLTQADVAKEAYVQTPHVSKYENGHHIAPSARKRIDSWVANHEGTT